MKVKIFDQGVKFQQNKNRITIMLIVPFYSFWPEYETRRSGCPIGLEMIAGELIMNGFNVIFIDACMSAYSQFTEQIDHTIRYGLTDQQLRATLARFCPDIVGITNLFSNQADNVEHLANIIKRTYPRTLLVEGGSHATGDVNTVLKNNSVDAVVREEGVATFLELCLAFEQKMASRNSMATLGVSFKNRAGQIIHNPSRPFIANLDSLAPRRLEITLHPMYDTSKHTGGSRARQYGRHAYLLSSVGCPLQCEFCHIHKMCGPTRYFSLERFEQEVARLAAAGVNEIILEDDMLFADIPRALLIGEILKRYNMVWFEEGGLSMFKFMNPGANLTYQIILDKLAASGCYRFYLAIESANSMSLLKSHKPLVNAQADLAEKIVRYTASKGIEGVGGFMLGFKGFQGLEESLIEMKNTVAYAKRLKQAGLTYVMLFIYTAIPGTNIYNYLKFVFPKLNLRTSHERAAFPVGGLSPAQLTNLRLKWMNEVNGPACMEMANRTKNWGL